MSMRLSARRVRSTYEFSKTNPGGGSVRTTCRVRGVAPSGYYGWLVTPLSNWAQVDASLLPLVQASSTES